MTTSPSESLILSLATLITQKKQVEENLADMQLRLEAIQTEIRTQENTLRTLLVDPQLEEESIPEAASEQTGETLQFAPGGLIFPKPTSHAQSQSFLLLHAIHQAGGTTTRSEAIQILGVQHKPNLADLIRTRCPYITTDGNGTWFATDLTQDRIDKWLGTQLGRYRSNGIQQKEAVLHG